MEFSTLLVSASQETKRPCLSKSLGYRQQVRHVFWEEPANRANPEAICLGELAWVDHNTALAQLGVKPSGVWQQQGDALKLL